MLFMEPDPRPDSRLPFPPSDETVLIAAARGAASQVAGTLRVALALVESGRQLDLSGFERLVGRLCAQAVDLAPEQGRALRPLLLDLLGQLNALEARLVKH